MATTFCGMQAANSIVLKGLFKLEKLVVAIQDNDEAMSEHLCGPLILTPALTADLQRAVVECIPVTQLLPVLRDTRAFLEDPCHETFRALLGSLDTAAAELPGYRFFHHGYF